MDFPRGDSEALYRGHISGRRLRGVKINPIYQENDVGRSGASDDTQSENSILVGEIQIDLYESLPRQRKIRQYNSDPMLLNSSMDHGQAASACNCDEKSGQGKAELPGEPATKLPHPASGPSSSNENYNDKAASSSTNGADLPTEDADDEVIESQSNKPSKEMRSLVQSKRSSGYLVRQARVGGVSDHMVDDHEAECKYLDASTSDHVKECPISPTSSPCHCNGSVKPNDMSNLAIRDRRSLEHAQDITVILDEMVAEIEAQELVKEGLDGEDGEDSCGNKDQCSQYSPTISDKDMKCLNCKSLNGDKYHTTEELANESSRVGYVLQRSPAYYCLDAIAKMPEYSDLHYIGSICPTDYINNNHVTIPDQMLMKPKSPSLGAPDKSPFSEADAFADAEVVHSLSNGSSIELELASKCGLPSLDDDKALPVNGCSCQGRPSLKCACGRLALQKLLKQKNMIVDSDEGNEIRIYSTISDETSTPDRIRKNIVQRDSDIAQKCSEVFGTCNDFEITHLSSSLKHTQTPQRDKHCQHNDLIKDRVVTFANDTIFNEYQSEYYKEENRILPCPEHRPQKADVIGVDNPVFVCDEEGNLHEIFLDKHEDLSQAFTKEFSARGTYKHPKAKNHVSANDSMLLNAGDLNVPHYMDSYLQGMAGNDVTETSKKAAPPVSIEAVGGTLFAGFDNITEASEDEFEYYRRRRKHKYDDYDAEAWLRKMDRPKKIKIGVVVFVIIAMIITGIALGVHFGAPSANVTVEANSDLVDSRMPGAYMAPF